MFKQVIITR